MRLQLRVLPLLPIMLMQGLYVRRITPRLPEPTGARDGVVGSGAPLRVLILGDSAAAGVGARSQSHALSGRLVAQLAGSYKVHWSLWAKTGDKARDVLLRLQESPAQVFDVVVTSIGVNDVTGSTRDKVFVQEQLAILDVLRTKFQAQHIFVSCLPPMQHFKALPNPLRAYLGDRAAQLNALLRDVLMHDDLCEFIDTDFPVAAQFLASDGFHPGEAAYAVWAERLGLAIGARCAELESSRAAI